MAATNIGEIVRALEGQAPWGVRLGVGSFLTMEFGRPANDKSGRANHGEWHLWLYDCAWRIESSENVIAGSEDDRQAIEGAIKDRSWGKITSIRLGNSSPDLAVQFSSGVRLLTFSASSARNQEQWLLFTPDGNCLTAYGDGTYEYVKQTEPRPRTKG